MDLVTIFRVDTSINIYMLFPNIVTLNISARESLSHGFGAFAQVYADDVVVQ